MKRINWFGFVPFYLLTLILVIGIAGAGSNAVTVISQNQPVERQHRIVIDAGHGGIDGGATSCTGVLESRINLEIALRVNDLFRFLGYETVMIRTTDESVYTEGNTIAAQKISDLKERIRISNETDGAILISIHQNTFSDSRYFGAQVFYAHTEGSDRLAKQLQDSFVENLDPTSNRKSKKAQNVYLLQNVTCQAALIECGFLSNPQEEAKLRSEDHQKKLAAIIASACSMYLSGLK